MPTRILREGILTSESVNRLSAAAELFYRRLMSVVDDYGRYHALIPILRANCYPGQLDRVTEEEVAALLAECVSVGLISLYHDGKCLLVHKLRQQKRGPSKFPEPPVPDSLSNCTADGSRLPGTCTAEDKQTLSTCLSEGEANAEPYTKAKAGGEEPRKSPPTAFSSSSLPSLAEVLEHGQRLGCAEKVCRKFFRHFKGKAGGWRGINWRKRLEGWLEEDQERARKKTKPRSAGVPVQDYL